MVQAHWGSQNTIADVFVTPAAEACIAARDSAGHPRVLVNLTTLGAWYRSGELTLDELRAWIVGEHAA